MAAKSMGKTTEEFNKLIASGQIMTKDFLPGFLDYVSKATKASGSYATALKKVGTEQGRAATELQLAVNEGFMAGESGFSKFFRDLADMIFYNKEAFVLFGKTFGAVAAGITTALKPVVAVVGFVSKAFVHFGKMFNDAMDASKPTESLTILQRVLRYLGRLLIYTEIGLLHVDKALIKLAGSFDESSKWLGDSTKDWIALVTVIISGVTAVGLLIKAFRLLHGVIKAPFQGISKLLSLIASMFGMKKIKDILDGKDKTKKGSEKGKSAGSGSPYKRVLEDARKERLAASPEGKGGWSGKMGTIGRSLSGAAKGLAAFGIGIGSVLSMEEAIKRYTEMNAQRKIPNELLMFPKQTITNNVTINVESSDPQGVTREIERKSKEMFSNMFTVAPTSSP